MNVAVVLPNWIGDVVMATPALKAIRDQLNPSDKLIGIMQPYVKQVLAGSGLLTDEISWEKKPKSVANSFSQVAQKLRAEHVDQIILLTNSFRSAALAWWAGIPQRIGYARNGRGLLLTKSLNPLRGQGGYVPISALDAYLKLTKLAGYPSLNQQTILGTTSKDENIVDEYWNRFALHGKRVIVMNSGGAYGSAKHWPAKHYVELGRKIVQNPENAVLLICGPNERDTVLEIQHKIDHPAVHSLATEKISIGVSKSCVRRASVMVTTDSGPRHFAAAFKVPTVTMFGPTDPRWADSYNQLETILFNKLDCGPCAKRICPLGTHQCMEELSVAKVLQAVNQHLHRTDKHAA